MYRFPFTAQQNPDSTLTEVSNTFAHIPPQRSREQTQNGARIVSRDHDMENNKGPKGNTFTAYLVVQILSTKNNYTRHGILVYGVLRKTMQTTATQATQNKTDQKCRFR